MLLRGNVSATALSESIEATMLLLVHGLAAETGTFPNLVAEQNVQRYWLNQ